MKKYIVEEKLNAAMMMSRNAKPCDIPILENINIEVGDELVMLSFSRTKSKHDPPHAILYEGMMEYNLRVSSVKEGRVFMTYIHEVATDFILGFKWLFESDTHLFVQCVDVHVILVLEKRRPVHEDIDIVLIAIPKNHHDW